MNTISTDAQDIIYKYQHNLNFRKTLDLIKDIRYHSQAKYGTGKVRYKVEYNFTLQPCLSQRIFSIGVDEQGEIGTYSTLSGRCYPRTKIDPKKQSYINEYWDDGKKLGYIHKFYPEYSLMDKELPKYNVLYHPNKY